MVKSIQESNQLDPCKLVTWIMIEVANNTSDDEDEVNDILNVCLEYLSRRGV